MAHSTDRDLELDARRRHVLEQHAGVIAELHDDGETPLTAAHAFRPPSTLTPAQGLGLLAAMALVLLSGFASEQMAAYLGIRASALAMLAIAAGAAAGIGNSPVGRRRALSTGERAVLLGTLVYAAATASATALALVPAFVHAAVARVLLQSLDDETTLIEKAARMHHPLAPAFIGPYCRLLTAAWAGLFAASAVVTALLAATGAFDAHRAWTGWAFWLVLGVVSFFEFFWRKAWFRYYGNGPVDRLLARAFPSQNTARGRRSAAYVHAMREELARLAETKRAERRSRT